MPSLKDVAELANVSVATASKVLNTGSEIERISLGCQQRVREAANQVGYVPNYHAQSIQRRRSFTLGAVLDVGNPGDSSITSSWLGNTYWGALVAGIESHVHNTGYLLTVVGPGIDGERAPTRAAQMLRQNRLDGLVVFGEVIHRDEQIAAVSALPEAPIVTTHYRGTSLLPNVSFAEKTGVAMAVQHLAELGHKRALWLGPPPTTGHDSDLHPRERLTVQALWEFDMRGSSVHLSSDDSNLRGRSFEEEMVCAACAAMADRLAEPVDHELAIQKA